ncbi:MAG: homocysteine S-methyltransferase family protein [Eubacteriales bacterium]
MKKEEFNNFIKNKIIYLDGATGSNLMKRGMPAGVCPESWILEHPDVMRGLQEEYIEAGSNIIYAPTFTANRIKLAEYGLADRIKEINEQLVTISKEASKGRALVAADLTMTGQQLAPIGTMKFDDLITVYKEQITYLVGAGVDLIVVETMMSLQETRAAVIAAKEVCDLPILVSMTFEKNGKTLFGTPIGTAAIVLEHLGVSAFGANCSTGPMDMSHIINDMSQYCSIPIIGKPNAGMPELGNDGMTHYKMDADTFGMEMNTLVEVGASILGGCCGSTPLHIEKLCENTSALKILNERKVDQVYITSERTSTILNDLTVIGDKISPAVTEELTEDLLDGFFDTVYDLAEEQEEDGAQALLVSFEMDGIDEEAMLLQGIDEIFSVVNLPLILKSGSIEILEKAVRIYPGRAAICIDDFLEEDICALQAIVQKYGAIIMKSNK